MAKKLKKSKPTKAIKFKIKTGDEVVVIAGKDKGKRGPVTQVLSTDNKVVVEGVNMVTKSVRPNPQKNIQGGLVKQERPIHASNVAILNAETDKADRIGFKMLKDGNKVRIYRSNGEQIDTK
jgi:large subunit ribosomal protein L24